MNSDRQEFDRSPKPTATPIFHSQQFRKHYLQLCENPQNWHFGIEWGGRVWFWKISYCKVGRGIPHSKVFVTTPFWYNSFKLLSSIIMSRVV